jgi:hypothetical protein
MDLKNIIMKSLKPFNNRGNYQPEKRRKYPRVLMDLPFEYWTQDNHHTRRGGIVINASQIGFLIHSIQNMCIGTQLKITVFYIRGYELADLEVFAEIVWKNPDKKKGMYIYGLKFIGILKEDCYRLKGLLAITLRPSPTPIRPSAESNKFRRV